MQYLFFLQTTDLGVIEGEGEVGGASYLEKTWFAMGRERQNDRKQIKTYQKVQVFPTNWRNEFARG